MAKHYTTRDFFRQMPNAMLARYFERKGLLTEVDFGSMKEARPDALFAAWLTLPDGQRHAMDSDFQKIHELSSERGFRAILDEADWHFEGKPDCQTAFVEHLAALANHCERAFVTFLDYPQFWKGATAFHHADTLAYWRKRKNLPHQPAAVHDPDRQALADLIRNYFHNTEGRGQNCLVEAFRRGKLDYFFAYPEDYSQQSVEWVDGEFDRRPHNPAFEVIYVYSQEEGSLDLNFRGVNKAVEPLQGMFATAILKLAELPPDPDDARIYDLNRLRDRGFQFVYPVGSPIKSVALKKMRLTSKLKRGDRVTLEASPNDDPHAIYDLNDKVAGALPRHLYNVSQVELAASVIVEAQKPPKTVTIRISYPNSCSLKYDEMDLKLRDMLEASGIEPKEPTQEEQTAPSLEAVEA